MSRYVRASMVAALFVVLVASPMVMAQAGEPENDGRYMIKFKEFRGAAQAVAAAGGRVVHELAPQSTIAAYLPDQALRGLQNNPNVEFIEVDPRRYLMAQTSPYGIAMVQANDAVFNNNNSAACTVCIIDSGYYRAHEDLQTSNVTGTVDSGSGNWYEDSCGHGTHVAGTIAALSNTVGVLGVNSNGSLRMHIEKVFNGTDCKWAYSSDLITALNRCRSNTPSSQKLVVSMSLGGSFSSTTENNAFQNAYDAGVLSVAAAGNDGSTRKSYPASYASVVSVAAVDSAGVVASFSQKNDAVEIAAPGVGVLSTTPFKTSTLNAGGSPYIGSNLDGSARTSVSGTLVDGGLCDSAGSWAGRVVLCERGVISFADKVANVKNGGGVGAAIYNNVDGGFAGTLNTTSTIPGISMARADGLAAKAGVGSSSTLDNTAGVSGQSYNGYEYYDGTSMATPHVSGVAALVWSHYTTKTNAQIRDALQKSAEDKGSAGKDTSYGYGIVKAKAAYDYLAGGGTTPPPAGITLSVAKVKVKGSNYADLTWSGATTSNVTVHRNTTTFSTANDGVHRDGPLNKGSYTYKVCNSDGSACSSSVTVSF
jgi:serine protease